MGGVLNIGELKKAIQGCADEDEIYTMDSEYDDVPLEKIEIIDGQVFLT